MGVIPKNEQYVAEMVDILEIILSMCTRSKNGTR